VVFVNKEGQVVFGRKNKGWRCYLDRSIAKNGNLVGKETLIGFIIPADMPEEIKTKMKFMMENANTFDLKRTR